MSREIKFRAWYKPDLELGNFMKFETVYSNDTVMFEWNEKITNLPFTYDVATVLVDNDWIKEQYTGLKDKNGVEIYEGDIIKVTIDLTYVGAGMLVENRVVSMEFEEYIRLYSSICNGADIEIIGSIHKNKELLNE